MPTSMTHAPLPLNFKGIFFPDCGLEIKQSASVGPKWTWLPFSTTLLTEGNGFLASDAWKVRFMNFAGSAATSVGQIHKGS